jgi:hypothetical protein
MSGANARRSSPLVGLVLGLAVTAAGVRTWRIPTAGGSLGADIWMLAGPTGQLDVAPVGPFLLATNLRPGAPAAQGSVAVRNQTGTRLAVHLRALPSEPDLDQLLVVELTAGGNRLFEGALGGLRTWTQPSFPLASGERTILRAVGAKMELETKGDANNTVERWAMPAEGRLGRVIYRVPKLGYFLVWAGSSYGRLALIARPTLVFGALGVLALWRPGGRGPAAHRLAPPGQPVAGPETGGAR